MEPIYCTILPFMLDSAVGKVATCIISCFDKHNKSTSLIALTKSVFTSVSKEDNELQRW